MRSPQPLHRIIAADEMLRNWQARHHREQALTLAVRRALPRQLGDRVRACELPDGQVELVASAGAIAAAVRQRAPDLLQALQGAGWSCTALRVRVQVAAGTPAPAKKPGPVADRSALAPMSRLAQGLPQGPLKLALARFLRRSGGAG